MNETRSAVAIDTSSAPGGALLSASELQSAAGRGFVWTVVSLVVSTPVAFGVNALVARVLGVADYGRLALLTMVLGVAAMVANFGVSDGTIQWGAAAHARGERSTVDLLLRKSLGFHLLVQVPPLLLVIAVMARGESPLIIGSLALGVVLPAALGSAALSISIENRSAAGAKTSLAIGLIAQTAVVCVAVLGHSAPGIWAARSVAGSLLLPLNFLLLDRARRRVALRPMLPRTQPDGFWRYCSYATASGLVSTLVTSRSEVILLSGFGHAGVAGVFALGFGLAQQITSPVDALAGPLLPAVTGLVAVQSDRAGQAMLRIARVGSLLGSVVAMTIVPAVYRLIPLVYGGDYSMAGVAFVALGLASCAQSVINPLYAFTRARRRSDLVVKIGLLALAVDVAVAVALIPRWPLLGACAANLAGFGVMLGLLAWLETTAAGVGRREYLGSLAPLGLACLTCLFVIVGQTLLEFSLVMSLVSGPVIAYAVQAAMLRLLPIPTGRQDVLAGLATMPPAVRRPATRLLSPLLPR